MQLTGAEILLECLIAEGVDVMFGYPGGAILPTYDAMTKYPQLRHVLVRHEQGASHMADGYSRASGKIGVCIATSGPGATNLVTGLATAMMDSVGIVAITGQVGRASIGTDAFQETDVTGVTLPVTKHNCLVMSAAEIPLVVQEAFHLARSGRPGPVLIDIPKDVQTEKAEFRGYPVGTLKMPGYQVPDAADPRDIGEVLELIRRAKRPLILAGHGVVMSGATQQLRDLAELAGIPVTLTCWARARCRKSTRCVWA